MMSRMIPKSVDGNLLGGPAIVSMGVVDGMVKVQALTSRARTGARQHQEIAESAFVNSEVFNIQKRLRVFSGALTRVS